MNTIWKFPFKLEDGFTVEMPRGSKVLCAQMQRDFPCMWALVSPASPMVDRVFKLAGTGHPISEDTDDLRYISTFQVQGLVFHLFEVIR